MIRLLQMARLTLLSACLVGSEAVSQSSDRPNILWLVSEDNSTFLGCYGDPLARTPTLDKLAREGVLFERCFAQPVCAPSRFTLITGTFAASSGPAQHMRAQGKTPSWMKGFPALLREAGYYAVNNAKTDYNAPIDLRQTWNQSNSKAHYRNRPDTKQPFFSVFNYMVTHESCLFPEKDVALDFEPANPAKVRVPPYQPDTPEIRGDWARYYDHLALMDAQIAAKLKELEQSGQAEDTIIFYFADNGGVLPRSKRFLQRSGTHVPLIVYFPPKWRYLAPAPPGSRLSQPVSFVDFAPTVLSLTGVKIPNYMPGRPFAGSQIATNEFVFCTRDRMDERYDMMRSVMDSRWLYIRNFRPDLPFVQPQDYAFKARGYQSWARVAREGKLTSATAQFWGEKPPEELYDLAADPDNLNNLATNTVHRATLDRMREALKVHTLEIVDNGFVPEGSTLEGYEASRESGALPLQRIYELALLASMRDPKHLPQLIAALDDSNEAIRWWAAQGCAMLREKALAAEAALHRRLGDCSGAVQVAAAEALARMGRTEVALPVLERQLTGTENPAFALQAANVLDRLGELARPALPTMKAWLARAASPDPVNQKTMTNVSLLHQREESPPVNEKSRVEDGIRRITDHSVKVLEGSMPGLVYPAVHAAMQPSVLSSNSSPKSDSPAIHETSRHGSIPSELFGVIKNTTAIEAFRPTVQFKRHDPSNIIRHQGLFWVFYTRNLGDHKEVSVHAAFSSDGYQWTDAGEAIGCGAPGSWDESGAIAPFVVAHAGKFYLFYTGFRAGNLATRELGCAIADHPSGPWKRWHANPILRRDPDPAAWDSGMLGDSNVIFREGKWWLYYKGRRADETNKDTRIGVAFADQITGPYYKYPGNPLFAGHAFSAWLHRDGVAALCGVISPKIKWSRDGLRFDDAGEFSNESTGLFTPEESSDRDRQHGFDWGLETCVENGAWGLRRFDCQPAKEGS